MSAAAITSSSFATGRCPSFVRSVETGIKKVSNIFYHRIISPAAVGVCVGAADFIGSVVILEALGAVGIEVVEGIEEASSDAIDAIFDSPWYTNLAGPFIEELVFRIVVQGSIKWVAAKFLPNREVEILGYIKLPLPQLVSIVATSILFGVAHYPDGGLALTIVCTVSGLVFGVLKERVGFVSSCAAHMMTNTLVDVMAAAF